MKRVAIFGRPGSGKSTFALDLKDQTGFPLHHLDKYFYIKNWIKRDHGEFLKIQKGFVDENKWIIDGNSLKSLEMRYAKADLILYFNYPKWICYWRIMKRLFSKDSKIQDRALGCKEQITFKFLAYIWTFEKRVEIQLKTLKEKYPLKKIIEINSGKDLAQVLKEIKSRK